MRLPRRPLQAGYTLVEMMIIVVIVGVLAMLATYGVRKYINASKAHEATWVIKDIKEGQEAFRRETHRYLDVSGGLNALYPVDPTTTVGAVKTQWGGGSGVIPDNWRMLQVSYSEPVQFGYACTAGGAGVAPPDPGLAQTVTWPTTTGPWYVVKAVGDLSKGGENSLFVGSSFTAEIWSENEGE